MASGVMTTHQMPCKEGFCDEVGVFCDHRCVPPDWPGRPSTSADFGADYSIRGTVIYCDRSAFATALPISAASCAATAASEGPLTALTATLPRLSTTV
jgi:hypothetical protein